MNETKGIPRVVRPKEIAAALSVNICTLYDWEQKKILPKRRKFGPGCVGWLEPEIKEWLASR